MLKSFREEYLKIEQKYFGGERDKEVDGLRKQLLSRPLVIFGVGEGGPLFADTFAAAGIKAECFCANRNTGKIEPRTGLQVITTQQLQADYMDANILLTVTKPINVTSISSQLFQYGFKKEQIFYYEDACQFSRLYEPDSSGFKPIRYLSIEEFEQKYLTQHELAYNMFDEDGSKQIIVDRIKYYLLGDRMSYSPDQYFPKEFLFSNDEVFVDVGLYVGDTSEEFVRRTNGKYKGIVGFEIDNSTAAVAIKNLEQHPNVEIIKKGLWSVSKYMNAGLGFGTSSSIFEGGEDTVELISLDEFFLEIPQADWPTFIKMDIEGSEMEALLGAKQIIKAVHPKLAICVYHKPEDIYELPKLIRSFYPAYKIMLKHHASDISETVLYAW